MTTQEDRHLAERLLQPCTLCINYVENAALCKSCGPNHLNKEKPMSTCHQCPCSTSFDGCNTCSNVGSPDHLQCLQEYLETLQEKIAQDKREATRIQNIQMEAQARYIKEVFSIKVLKNAPGRCSPLCTHHHKDAGACDLSEDSLEPTTNSEYFRNSLCKRLFPVDK